MSNEIQGFGTRGELATRIANFLQDTSTPRRTEILAYLDQGYRLSLQRFAWPQLVRWLDASITMVAGVGYFHTGKDVRVILGLLDSQAPFKLEEFDIQSELEYSRGFVNLAGGPTKFSFVGLYGTNATITANTALEVVSDGADTRSVWVRGFLGAEARSVNATLNGATAVSVGSFDDVVDFSVQTADVSRTITIREVTGSVNRGFIAPQEMAARYRRYRLLSIPSNANNLRIIYKYTPPTVYNEGHEYIIPVEDYLFDWALGRAYQSRRQWEPAQQHLALAETSLLTAWGETEANRVHLAIPINKPRRPIGIVVQTTQSS